MSAAPAPKITRARTLPLIWIVPIVALVVAGWMIFREQRNHGPEISIEFADGSGVEAGKTPLEYNGVAVGTVQTVELTRDLARVVVRVRLKKNAANVARAGAEFWIVHPEVSFSGVRGLETLVRGVRLNVRPGSGAPATRFQGLDSPPAPELTAAGRAFILKSDRLGSLAPGAPVYYREVKVGAVETSRLARDATSVLIRIRVFNPYIDLVRTNTRFWNASFSIKGGLFSGFDIKNVSLETLFTGGVGFATPEGNLAPAAADGAEFSLADEPEKEWLKWQPQIPIAPVEQAPDSRGATPPTTIVKPESSQPIESHGARG